MKNSKKIMSLILASALVLSLTACQSGNSGSTESTAAATSAAEPAPETVTKDNETDSTDVALSGTVALGGSTSMESVIGYLKEQFTDDNAGVTISYAGVGSGGGIEGVSNGTYDIGLSSRDLKDEEKADAWFVRIKDDLISALTLAGADAEYCLEALMTAKYLEKIGDHAENVAGWVEYSITGSHPKNNPDI